jgi:hypothetical protein
MGTGFPVTRVRHLQGVTTAAEETAHPGYIYVLNVLPDGSLAPLADARVTIRPLPILVVTA